MSGRIAHQPAWVKLVATAAILAIAWILGQTMGHVLLVFTVSTIVALLLNPLVRMLCRLRIPRGLAVPAVFTGAVAVTAADGDRWAGGPSVALPVRPAGDATLRQPT